MADPQKKVVRGERLRGIPAASWNAFVDASKAHRSQLLSAGAGAGVIPDGRQTGIVLVQNVSGAPVDQFGVLGLGPPIILPVDNADEFARRVTFEGTTPVLATHGARFAILLEPLADGAIGKAVVSGVTVGRVHVTTAQLASPPIRAEIDDASASRLALSDDGPAEVLWQETLGSEGDAWAVLRLGASAPVSAGAAFSGARVYRSSQQIIADNTNTLITFDSERWDTDGYHSTSSNTGRLTVPASGYYNVGCIIILDSGTTGHTPYNAQVTIYRFDGTQSVAVAETIGPINYDSTAPGGFGGGLHCTTIAPASAGNYFYVAVWHWKGSGTSTFLADATYWHADFWIQKVG